MHKELNNDKYTTSHMKTIDQREYNGNSTNHNPSIPTIHRHKAVTQVPRAEPAVEQGESAVTQTEAKMVRQCGSDFEGRRLSAVASMNLLRGTQLHSLPPNSPMPPETRAEPR